MSCTRDRSFNFILTFTSILPTPIMPALSPTSSTEDFFTDNTDVGPDQLPTVLHQTTTIPFAGLEGGGCKLAVDASPGCGGVVWPAGEV